MGSIALPAGTSQALINQHASVGNHDLNVESHQLEPGTLLVANNFAILQIQPTRKIAFTNNYQVSVFFHNKILKLQHLN